ncbi:phosphate-starvation-inducible PsiE family protein [Flavobacterium buctense]|uniref:Phosphate-starvation-inducible PsiE family protein n=1 Tax=Flavobacterium buctense TaxID=1648146 RepID=A0ABU9E2N9_9FLAO|nr:phosphate-starvation-inducible PsiE family protein [Flavobacterium buctense]
MKDKIVHKSEKIIYLILTIILLLYIVFQIVDLGYQFVIAVSNYNFGNPDVLNNKIFSTVAVIFFNILISIEILETFKEHENNVEYKSKIIILIAITAMTRKIITIDVKHLDYLTDIGIAVLVLSLCIGYYFISKTTNKN